jgi:hypothetical protein
MFGYFKKYIKNNDNEKDKKFILILKVLCQNNYKEKKRRKKLIMSCIKCNIKKLSGTLEGYTLNAHFLSSSLALV